MGNCLSWAKKRRQPGRKVTLAIVGLDNAGKTVTTKGLKRESLDTVAPTIGFSTVDFKFDKNEITLYDLGGGKKIRGIWENYFSEIYGLIFVVDSTDPDRMDECRQVLTSLLENKKISGKPVLLLANKQDVEGAMDELDVCHHLNLEDLVNLNKCPCRVETCAAILGQGRKLDKSIKNGMRWLLSTVNAQWEKLNLRVEKDMAEQREREAREKKARAEAVRKIREERERKEKHERRLRGEPDPEEEDQTSFTNGGPFKRLDAKELSEKHERLKQEKKKKESEQKSTRDFHRDYPDDWDDRPAPRSSRSHSGSFGDHTRILGDRHSEEMDDMAITGRARKKRSLRAHRSLTPSPENTPRLSRRRMGSSPTARSEDDDEDNVLASRSPWLKKRSPRPLDSSTLPAIPTRTPRSLHGEEDMDLPAPTRGRTLMPLSHLEPLENVDSGRTRKKKKRTRRNQVAATSDDDGRSDTGSVTSADALPPARSFGGLPGQRSLLKASRSPRLETATEELETENDSFSQRWGLAEDLADIPDNASYRRTRPNVDSDEDIIT